MSLDTHTNSSITEYLEKSDLNNPFHHGIIVGILSSSTKSIWKEFTENIESTIRNKYTKDRRDLIMKTL